MAKRVSKFEKCQPVLVALWMSIRKLWTSCTRAETALTPPDDAAKALIDVFGVLLQQVGTTGE